MSQTDEAERRRLQWRCRRGMRELDALMCRYLEARWPQADVPERAQFERLLAVEDDRLWRWFLGREEIVDPDMNALVARILALPH